jgi:hypothetical protein
LRDQSKYISNTYAKLVSSHEYLDENILLQEKQKKTKKKGMLPHQNCLVSVCAISFSNHKSWNFEAENGATGP